MPGPEAMYAAMTSGHPGALGDAIADCRRAMGDLSDSIELVRFAQDKPDWNSPSARTQFNMRAWATKAAAEVAFIRVNRTSLALTKVRADYVAMVSDATEVIEAWRAYKKTATSPFFCSSRARSR